MQLFLLKWCFYPSLKTKKKKIKEVMTVISDIAYIASKIHYLLTFLLHTNFNLFYPHIVEIYLLLSVYPDKAEDTT